MEMFFPDDFYFYMIVAGSGWVTTGFMLTGWLEPLEKFLQSEIKNAKLILKFFMGAGFGVVGSAFLIAFVDITLAAFREAFSAL